MDKNKLNFADWIAQFIFGGRWILGILYPGLMIGMIIYSAKFVCELWEMIIHFTTISEQECMLKLLSLVDITMVGNLVLMIMVGGWHIFVRKIDFADMKSKPGWLNSINSGTLKVKMGMSLIGVSSIQLLTIFITLFKAWMQHEEIHDWNVVWMLLVIHCVFILSTLALGWVDRMLHPATLPHPDNTTGSEKPHA